jgi:hypothetical protein
MYLYYSPAITAVLVSYY